MITSIILFITKRSPAQNKSDILLIRLSEIEFPLTKSILDESLGFADFSAIKFLGKSKSKIATFNYIQPLFFF